VHLPAAAWGVIIEFVGWPCPLTPLENAFRARGGQAGYGGGFIEHYLTPLLYPHGLTRTAELALGALALVLNVAVYWWVLRRHRATGSGTAAAT
jgi:hypothetical protein